MDCSYVDIKFYLDNQEQMTPKRRHFDDLEFDNLLIEYKDAWLSEKRPDIPHGKIFQRIELEIRREVGKALENVRSIHIDDKRIDRVLKEYEG